LAGAGELASLLGGEVRVTKEQGFQLERGPGAESGQADSSDREEEALFRQAIADEKISRGPSGEEACKDVVKGRGSQPPFARSRRCVWFGRNVVTHPGSRLAPERGPRENC
jgi:hypothetical protein